MSPNLVIPKVNAGGYKLKKCLNPACGAVVAGREDKKFCCSKCKSRYHNEVIRKENENVYYSEKIVRSNEKQLKNLFLSGRYNVEGVPLIILQDRGISLHFFSQIQKSKDTGQNILWSFLYGIEPLKGKENYFIIHKRNKTI